MSARLKCEAVLLDVGGTLITPWPSVGHVYAESGGCCGYPSMDPEVLNLRFTTAWKRRKQFDYSRKSWLEIVQECVEGMVATEDLDRFFLTAYGYFERPMAWRIYDDVEPCLEILLGKGVKLGVVSNFDDRLVPLLRGLKLSKYFEVIVASGLLGVHKPSPDIFHHACRQLRVFPGVCVHVGDRMDEDVVGANAAGIVGWLLDRCGKNEEAPLRSLRELPEKVADFRSNSRNKGF